MLPIAVLEIWIRHFIVYCEALGCRVKTVYIFKTISHKNRDVVILPLTSPNVNRFSKFIHSKIDFSRKFAIIFYLKYIVIHDKSQGIVFKI